MKGTLRSLCCSLLAVSIAFGLMGQAAAQTSLTAGQSKFREIYKELVETDTSVDTGNCTGLADKIEKRLRAAGFTDSEIYRFAPGDFPRGGGVVVTLSGTSNTAKAILLLGHIDVVNAPAEGWTSSPLNFRGREWFFLWPRYRGHEGPGRNMA